MTPSLCTAPDRPQPTDRFRSQAFTGKLFLLLSNQEVRYFCMKAFRSVASANDYVKETP